MSAEELVARLRRFLLALTAFICLGTPVELWLMEHTGETLQWTPFILCALGLLAVIVVWLRPSRQTIRALRVVLLLMALGSGAGMFFHLNGNFAFELDIRPGAGTADVLIEALRGANPLLAPGVIALAALLGAAATYYHPALQPSNHGAGV